MRGLWRGKKLCGLLIMLFTLLAVNFANGAQSTADAVADDALKEKLRSEIVGAAVYPGEKQEYIIGYGDRLSVSIYGEGDMAASLGSAPARQDAQSDTGGRSSGGGVEVRLDGRISLLHIGDVNVVGMTLTQLADYLKTLYSNIYADPLITTVLMQSNSRRYTVMGQVVTPGIFYIDYPITIVQTIARSGGFTEWANHEITVVRAGDGLLATSSKADQRKIEFDYDDLVKGKDIKKNVYINSGDIIIVH